MNRAVTERNGKCGENTARDDNNLTRTAAEWNEEADKIGRLSAAAPELLKACRAALLEIIQTKNIPLDFDGSRPQLPIERKLRTAIAMAEDK